MYTLQGEFVYGCQGSNDLLIINQGWNKTWDECVPEQRLLKMTPTNLQKQKDLQLASKQKLNEAEAAKSKKESDAKLKKNEGDSTIKLKKADVKTKKTVVDGQKLSNTEVGASKQQRSGTPPVGGKRSSFSGGNKKGSSSSSTNHFDRR